MSSGDVWTIVVAAGSGQRFGAAKQFADLAGVSVLDRAVAVAAAVSDGCVVVVPADVSSAELPDADTNQVYVVGGATRSASVRAGLAAVPSTAEVICVHDAARPLATAALYRRVVAAVRDGADGAIPGVAVADTIKIVDAPVVDDATTTVASTPDRARLVAVQTPQAFAAAALRAAHATDAEATDDAGLVERRGGHVVVVAGEAHNRKLTTPDDLVWARHWLADRPEPVPTSVEAGAS